MCSDRYLYIKNGDVVTQIQEIGWPPMINPDGGANAFLSDFLNSMRDDQLQLIGCGVEEKEFQKGAVRAKSYPCGKTTGSQWRRALEHFNAVFLSIFQIKRFKPTKVICGSAGFLLWLAYATAKLKSVPIVHSRHNRVISPDVGFIRSIISSVDIFIIKRCSGVICHGPYLRQQLLDIGVAPEKLYEFDLGFKDFMIESQQSEVPSAIPDSSDICLIAFVGRIEGSKGVFDLLEVTIPLIRDRPNVILAYAGDGAAIDELKEKIGAYGCADRVHLLGKLNRKQLAGFVRKSTVLVAPTRSSFPEGRCMAVMEGLVLGVPVIVPNFGPFPYLIEHEVSGLLFRPDDVNELEACLRRVVVDEDLRAKIKIGALKKGETLINPPTRFAEAVSLAFRLE